MHLYDARNTPSPEETRKQAKRLAIPSKEGNHRELVGNQNFFRNLKNLGLIIQLFTSATLLYFAHQASPFWISTGIFGALFLLGYLSQRLSVIIQVWNRDGVGIFRLIFYQYAISWLIACVVYGAGVGLRSFTK